MRDKLDITLRQTKNHFCLWKQSSFGYLYEAIDQLVKCGFSNIPLNLE